MKSLLFILLLLPTYSFSQLIINEFLASNNNGYFDNFQEDNDWVEIYNGGNSKIDMGGMYFTDNISEGVLYQIPESDSVKTTMAPGEYLLFWFDKDPEQGILHIDCKLGSKGEQIALYESDGETIIDSLTYGKQTTNISFGRKPDGDTDWMFFQQPTPNMSNTSTGYYGILEEIPVFSFLGGFYNNSVKVWISSSIGSIHYTKDGSKPNMGSPVFMDSINIDSTTIIRASIFESHFISRNIMTQTYFINESFDSREMPVFSISTDPGHLWNSDTGIYVQDFKPEWEYPVNIEFYENNGVIGFNHEASIRIVGDLSWQLPQKMLSVSLDDDINYPLLDGFPRKKYNSFNLRCSGSDWSRTLFRDGLIQAVSNNDMDIDIQGFKPSILYMNGEYMGIHNVRQKLNDNYIEENYYIKGDDVDIIENYADVISGDDVAFKQLYEKLENVDLSNNTEYIEIKDLIDIDNYIDFIITEIYVANQSWQHNIITWKPKHINSSKWRWMLIDLDRGLLKAEIDENYIGMLSGVLGDNPEWSTLLFSRLLENKEFCNLFISRFSDYLYITFHTNSMNRQIMNFKSYIDQEVPFHVERWKNDTSSYGDGIHSYFFWSREVDKLSEFVEVRDENVRTHLKNRFDLQDVRLDIGIESHDAGKIKLNNLLIPEDNWSGRYIKEIPITFEAIPKLGYKFSHWQLDGMILEDSTASRFTDSLIKNTNLIAHFVVDTIVRKNIVINEINYSSSSTFNTGDWIELYNPNDYSVDMSNWKISDSENSYTIPNNTTVINHGYIIISNDVLSFNNLHPNIDNVVGNSGISLNNNTDLIIIHNHEGYQIDSLVYKDNDPWPDISNNLELTIELNSYLKLNEEGVHWYASNNTNGTPGEINSLSEILVRGIQGEAINYGDYFTEIILDNYVSDPDFIVDSISWGFIMPSSFNLIIDPITRVGSLTYQSGWRGTDMIHFIATNPLGESSRDSARFSVGKILNDSVFCNMILTKNESPYIVESTINIPVGCNMMIDPGVQVILKDDSDIIVKGKLVVNGDYNNMVHLFPQDNKWGGILLDSAVEKSIFNFVLFEGGSYGQDSAKANAVLTGYYSNFDLENSFFKNNLRCVYANHGNIYINNSTFYETNFGEKVNIQFANVITENSVFYYTHGDNDAIDYDAVNAGVIRNNALYGGDDDGLDIGQINNIPCQDVILENNTISGFLDKGISIGEGSQNINILYNVITDSQMGIAVKDSSTALIDHNTLYKNEVGISCYEKNTGEGGGVASVSNTIISESIISSVYEDYVSDIRVIYSLSDIDSLDGDNNITAAPQFRSPFNNDFYLTPSSSCINSGDPDYMKDKDGTITDIGAFYYEEFFKIIIYPNPAVKELHVRILDELAQISNIRIYNINGVLVEEFNNINDNQTQITLTNLKKTGIYLIQIYDMNDRRVGKRIIYVGLED